MICRNASVLAFHLWPTIFAGTPLRLQNRPYLPDWRFTALPHPGWCLVCLLTSKFIFMRNSHIYRRISSLLQSQHNICTCNTKVNIVYIVQSGKCLIDGQCYDASEVDPADESGNCDLGESSTERTTSKSDYFNDV